MSNSLDLDETQSYSASHPDSSFFNTCVYGTFGLRVKWFHSVGLGYCTFPRKNAKSLFFLIMQNTSSSTPFCIAAYNAIVPTFDHGSLWYDKYNVGRWGCFQAVGISLKSVSNADHTT